VTTAVEATIPLTSVTVATTAESTDTWRDDARIVGKVRTKQWK
jgi:hypothetical protein